MASRYLILIVLLTALGLPSRGATLPGDAAAALHNGTNAVLYSLEPWATSATNVVTLHNFKILGQAVLDEKQTAVAAGAIESAVVTSLNFAGSDCFDPRHALHVQSAGHAYDFLICYACGWMYVYRDDKYLAEIPVHGSPKALNALLKSLNLPVSKTGSGG